MSKPKKNSSEVSLRIRMKQDAWQGGLKNPITGYYVKPVSYSGNVGCMITKIQNREGVYRSTHTL